MASAVAEHTADMQQTGPPLLELQVEPPADPSSPEQALPESAIEFEAPPESQAWIGTAARTPERPVSSPPVLALALG